LAGRAAPAETNLSPISRAAFSQAPLLPGSSLPPPPRPDGCGWGGSPPPRSCVAPVPRILPRIGEGCSGWIDGARCFAGMGGPARGGGFGGGRVAAGCGREHPPPLSVIAASLCKRWQHPALREKSQHPHHLHFLTSFRSPPR